MAKLGGNDCEIPGLLWECTIEIFGVSKNEISVVTLGRSRIYTEIVLVIAWSTFVYDTGLESPDSRLLSFSFSLTVGIKTVH